MSTQFLHYVWRYHVWLFFKHVYHILSFRERYAPTYHGMCYLYRIFCPEDGHTSTVSLWTIMSKVRLEAFMWVSCIMHDKNAITFFKIQWLISNWCVFRELGQQLVNFLHTLWQKQVCLLWSCIKRHLSILVHFQAEPSPAIYVVLQL